MTSVKTAVSALALVLAGAAGASAQEAAPKIGMSVGSLGHPFFTATINGAKAAAAKIDPSAAITTVSSEWDLTKQDGQIDTFISAGANLAAEQAKRSEMKIAFVDGSPEVVGMLRDGGSRIVATAARDPYQMGAEAIRIGWEIVGGKKPDQAVMLLELSIVTAANAKSVEGWPQSR